MSRKIKKIENKEKEVALVHPKEVKTHWSFHWTLIGMLLVVNAALIYPLLFDGYSKFIESIEGAHLANANYLLNHWSNNWNNLWYFGFPSHLTYPPLVPALMAVLVKISGITMSHSYRLIIALFTWLTPVSLYLFIHQLTNRKTTAFLSALMYILLPSVAYLCIPQVLPNMNLAGAAPYQWVAFAQYGEGPHLASLFFLPLACLFFVKSFRFPDVKNYFLAGIFTALTLLTNLFGGAALLMMIVILSLGKIAIYFLNFNYKRLILLMAIAYGLTAFAYDFGFMDSILKSSYIHPENTIHLPPFLVVFLVILFGVLPVALFARHKMMGQEKSYPLFVSLVSLTLFLGAAAVYYHFNYSIISQPNRYLPEAQIAAVLLVSIFATKLIDRVVISKNKHFNYSVAMSIALGLILLLSYSYLSKPYYLLKAEPMSNTYEYKIAEWLDQNIDKTTGERVYLTGTPAFWLNTWKDIPQIRGDADNAQPNPWWADISYQINKGEDAELAKAWLQIMNVKYILINYPESGTHYVDYENDDRFNNYENVTEFADGGYKLKAIPGVNLGLFSVVDSKEIQNLGTISKVTNKDNVLGFAKLINQKNDNLSYQILSTDQYKVSINNLKKEQSIVFKMNYDPRWQAKDGNGKLIKISAVGPNYILLEPSQDGNIEITLQATRTMSEYIGIIITSSTIVILVWFFYKRKQKFID